MSTNKMLKILSSLPVILIFLYFIPFIGICLIILRYFVYGTEKYFSVPTDLIAMGLILLIPKLFNICLKLLKINIVELNNIINTDMYLKLIEYSKFIISVGIIFLVISTIFKNIFNKIQSYMKDYINKKEQIMTEVAKQNDMEIKEKQEKAKNTHVVICPNCGADNILTESVGKCKYCRKSIH